MDRPSPLLVLSEAYGIRWSKNSIILPQTVRRLYCLETSCDIDRLRKSARSAEQCWINASPRSMACRDAEKCASLTLHFLNLTAALRPKHSVRS